MPTNDTTPLHRRQRIFAELVRAQDESESVKASRYRVAAKWGLTGRDVEGIEREGLKFRWPPLT